MDPHQQVPLCSVGQGMLLESSWEVQAAQNSVSAPPADGFLSGMSRCHSSPLAGGAAVVSRPLVISSESWGSIQISEHAEIILASDSSSLGAGRA